MSSSKSLCREAPAGSGLRSIGDERPKSPPLAIWPGSSSPNSDEPPPRLSRIVSSPRKRCSTTSVEYFSTPCWSVHLRVCSWPSRYTLEPFFRYCSATRARFSLKITTECHSVFSLRSPDALSFQFSDVAIRRFTTGSPLPRRRTSGSRPRLPTNITLFTDPAITASPHSHEVVVGPEGSGGKPSREFCTGLSPERLNRRGSRVPLLSAFGR